MVQSFSVTMATSTISIECYDTAKRHLCVKCGTEHVFMITTSSIHYVQLFMVINNGYVLYGAFVRR